jgi:hypothetical protein
LRAPTGEHGNDKFMIAQRNQGETNMIRIEGIPIVADRLMAAMRTTRTRTGAPAGTRRTDRQPR